MIMVANRNAFCKPETFFKPPELALALETQFELVSHGLLAEGSVVFPGLNNTQDQLAATYRHFSVGRRAGTGVFCSVPLFEPFGLMPLEAAMAGLPVVFTKNGGPVSSLNDDEPVAHPLGFCRYGCLVDPARPDQISAALLELIRDPKAWAHYHEVGRQRVLDHYRWESAASRYLDAVLLAVLPRASIIEHIPTALELATPPVIRKLDRSRLAVDKNGWAYLVAVDIDQTMYRPDRAKATRKLDSILRHSSIPLCYVTGASVSKVLERVSQGELPMPDVICSSVGTRRYLRVGRSLFVLDPRLEADFRLRGFNKAQLLDICFRIGHDVCGSSFAQQSDSADPDQAFKLSFYFFGNPRKGPEQGSDIVRSQFTKRLQMLAKCVKIIVCEEFKHNQTIEFGAPKKYCLDIVAASKEYAVNSLLFGIPRVQVLTAGDR